MGLKEKTKMMNNFEIAAYAAKCHSQQKRRYTDDPYIIHPLSVASIVENAFPDNMVMMQSALLHDVIEDCGKTYHDIYEIAGLYVATIVDKFLTDQFTSKKYLVIQVCFYLYDDESFEYLSRTITLGDE